MSLVVEASPSSPTTTSSTSDHEGASLSPFALPESPPVASNLYNQLTPVKAIDLLLRSSHNCQSPVARVWSRSAVKRANFGDHRDFPHQAPADCDGELSTPAKKASKRLLDLEPFAAFDSNSRDSGFDSEASRLSYSLSTGSGGLNSNPGTPSSSSSIHSIGHGLCLTPVTHDDPTKSTHLCLWDDCCDPDLLLEDEDDARRDLLSHVLSRHVQPLESESEKCKDKGQPTLFKCLWRGCKVHGKGSKLFSWLESHVVERHAGPRPFACPLPGCQQRFGSKLSAERHINSHFASDDPPTKEKDSCKMAPSNLVNKPSPISSSTFRRRDTTKSPLSKQQQQQIAANTRASAKRRLLQEECQQPHKRPQEKPLDRLAVKTRRDNAIQRSIVNGSKAVKRSRTVEKSSSRNGIRTRHGGKFRLDLNGSIVRRSGQSESNGDKAKTNAEAPSLKKQLSSNSTSSSQSRNSSVVSINKKSAPVSSIELNTTKAVLTPEAPGTAAVGNGINGAAKRKTVRIRHCPEDAFDAMHARSMHVLAARYVLSTKKPTENGKKNWPSCHKCSGNSPHTDMSPPSSNCRRSETTSRHCVCSDYITFHAKVLAKRTCPNGKRSTNESCTGPQNELFCVWTPPGLLPPKWVEESSFQSTICLPRSLFPSLKALESSDDDEDEEDVQLA